MNMFYVRLCVDTTLVYSLSRGWKKLIKKQPVTKEKIRKTFRNPGKPTRALKNYTKV